MEQQESDLMFLYFPCIIVGELVGAFFLRLHYSFLSKISHPPHCTGINVT
jgi:hypothetical protein